MITSLSILSFSDNLFISRENSLSKQIGILIFFESKVSVSFILIFLIFSFKFSKFIIDKSKDIINLLYDGVIFIISLRLTCFSFLKYLITFKLISLLISLPKSQYKAASPRLDIFLSVTCYNSKLLLWKLI